MDQTEATLEVPQTSSEVAPKAKRRGKKKMSGEKKVKRQPNKWQLYIKERCHGKKFTTQKESQEHMRACAVEFRKQNPRMKKEEVMVEN